MYSEEIENLINAAMADGVLTDKEKQIIINKAKSQGIDPDEMELVLGAKVFEFSKNNQFEENYDEIPSIVNSYRAEFEAIKKTKIEKEWFFYTKTGKRGEYRDVEHFDNQGTLNAKRRYLISINPVGKVETIAALKFLISFIPSYESVSNFGLNHWKISITPGYDGFFKEDLFFADCVKDCILKISQKAKKEYGSDEEFMSEFTNIKEQYNMIYNQCTKKIEENPYTQEQKKIEKKKQEYEKKKQEYEKKKEEYKKENKILKMILLALFNKPKKPDPSNRENTSRNLKKLKDIKELREIFKKIE